MNTRCIVLGVGCLLLVASAKYAGSDAKPPVVEVALPLTRDVTDFEVFAGRIEVAERVDLRARVTGYVTTVHFKPGQTVSNGQILFEIDARPYLAALDLAEAQLLLADAKIKRSGAELDRAKELVRLKAMSREDFDKIVADRAELEAGRRIAVAGVELARLNLDFTKVAAPIVGKIGAPALSVGNLVRADDTRLATISSVDSARVVFHVDEVSLLRLHELKKSKGKETPVPVSMGRADDKGFPHSGTLDLDDLRIEVKTDTVVCRAIFPNADGKLVPGMFARVRVATSGPYKTLAVDPRAIHDPVANGIYYVLVVNEKNILEKRAVQLASKQGLWGIKSGLKAEDWIVVNCDREWKAGMTVQPKRVVMKDSSVAPPQKLPEKKTPTEPPPASTKLRDLMKERHVVLVKAADVVRALHKAGAEPFSAVLQARQAVIEADLDLCETHAERIALLRENLKMAEEAFKLTTVRRKADHELSVLQAQAMLLDAQIRLLREEEKAKGGK